MNQQLNRSHLQVEMTAAEWKRTHRDFKTIKDGQRYVLRWTDRGTCLVPVLIVKGQQQ